MPTPNTGIPVPPEGTLDITTATAQALYHIDALLQTAVERIDLDTPPGSPADGDLYIVSGTGGTATGAWAGHETDLARYFAEGDFWQFFTAGNQVHLIYNRDDFGFYKFDGGTSPGVWSLAAGLGDAPADGFQYARRDNSWEAVTPELTAMNDASPPTIESNVQTLVFEGADIAVESGGVVRVSYQPPVIPDPPPAFNKQWVAGAGALEVLGGTAATVVGTATTPAKATGGTQIRGYISKRVQTSTTAANNVASLRAANSFDEVYAAVTGNSRAAGFYAVLRFGTPVVVAGERFFAGFAPNAAEAGTVDASTLINCIGVGKDAADANYQIMHNDGSGTATKIDTGLAVLSGKSFELILEVPRGGGSCTYTLTDRDTGTEYAGSFSADLPAADVPLLWRVWGSVGASAGVAIAIETSFVGIRYAL